MPRIPTQQLVQSIIDGIEIEAASATLISPPNSNPRKFLIQSSNHSQVVWIYIWTLTHGGGRARPANEFRIQITGIDPPILLNPLGPTLLLGFEPNIGCFAGFDITKHLIFSTRSPSIQIPIDVLENASELGLSFIQKGNDEIALGIRPDNLLFYINNAEILHQQGGDHGMLSFLPRVLTMEEITPDEISRLPEERQRTISTISRFVRDSHFRRKVYSAYNHKCAVTGMQLQLIEAAHILPVQAAGSTDNVTNGVCLSPTFHRAFDRGLIYLNTNFEMKINERKEHELSERNLSEGIDIFRSYLNKTIYLPENENHWPDIQMINEANRFYNNLYY